jgi:uncharacterized protein YehS (DUF1456 family)
MKLIEKSGHYIIKEYSWMFHLSKYQVRDIRYMKKENHLTSNELVIVFNREKEPEILNFSLKKDRDEAYEFLERAIIHDNLEWKIKDA